MRDDKAERYALYMIYTSRYLPLENKCTLKGVTTIYNPSFNKLRNTYNKKQVNNRKKSKH